MCAMHREHPGEALEWWRYLPVLIIAIVMISSVWYLLLGNESKPVVQSDPVVPGMSALPTHGPTATAADPSVTPEPIVNPKGKPFLPEAVVIDGVGVNRVERLPRIWINDNLIEFPSPSGYNPSTYAWDTSSAKPGTKKGTVILVAHSFSTSDQALGNKLMRSVGIGDMVVLRGSNESAAYSVTERLNLHGSDEYYKVAQEWLNMDSAHTLALTVCSDYNQATGEWDSKMVWLAAPMK